MLLGLSIFGLGDILTPFERMACRLADEGCTPQDETANAGEMFDSVLSSVGAVMFMAACFVLAGALAKVPRLRRAAWPARIVAIVVGLALFAIAPMQEIGLDGLMERIVALVGSRAIAAAAVWVLRADPARANG